MSDWSTRPRVVPITGRRKGTHVFCDACGVLHRTHRAVGGPDTCPAIEQARADRRHALFAAPHLRTPKAPTARMRMRPDGTVAP